MDWSPLGASKPADLAPARDQAHHAAQVVAAFGETHLAHVEDTSHTALTWSATHRALLGGATPGPHALRTGLRLHDLSLLLVGPDETVVDERALAGATRSEALAWTVAALSRHSGGALDGALTHPGYAMPPHPVERGAAFEADPAALAELSRWYANADGALRERARRTPGASAVLTWPHHFDIAVLVTVESDAHGNATKTLGMGLSPGDGEIADPYWYVNHWPARESPELGALAAGGWHTGGFTAAVLRADELLAAGDGPTQAATLGAFLESAVAATRSILAGPESGGAAR